MVNEPIDISADYENFGEHLIRFRVPKKESVKKPKPDQNIDARVPYLTQLREDLTPLSTELVHLTPDEKSRRIELLVSWIQDSIDHGPQLDPEKDLDDPHFPNSHNLSGIKVTFQGMEDGKDKRKRIQHIYEALDRHIKTWNRFKKADPSFDLTKSVHTVLSPLFINKQHVARADIDAIMVIQNRFVEATWMRDKKQLYSQHELKAYQYLLNRRIKFLERIKQDYDPQSILYVESGSDQIPSILFGQEKMTNFTDNTSENTKWHMGESQFTTEDLASSESVQQFDLIYFSKFDKDTAKNFPSITKKLKPGGFLIFDTQNLNQKEWVASHYQIAEVTAQNFETVDMDSEFGDIMDEPLTDLIAQNHTTNTYRQPLIMQQCFRVFSKSIE